MKIIDSNAEIVYEQNPYRLIEQIGRTCYKSESLITPDSCYKFVDRLVQRRHYAMLEHYRFVITTDNPDYADDLLLIPYTYRMSNYMKLYHVCLSMSHIFNTDWNRHAGYDFLVDIRNMFEAKYRYNTEYKSKYSFEFCTDEDLINQSKLISIKFICDRGVSHELVRHRCAIAQESTRYCDYTKEKFGSELTFIRPANFDKWQPYTKAEFNKYMEEAENQYKFNVTQGKLTPQEARAFLPHALKTEVVLSMNFDQWDHFFDLRMRGTTGAPHPDMKLIAEKAYRKYTQFLNYGIVKVE